MMKRRFSFLLALALIAVFVLPVSAEETESAWVELLETSTVNDSGSNVFTIGSTANVTIKLPQMMRLTKIDMLITYPSGYAPSTVKLRYNGSLYSLTIKTIDSMTARVYGSNIPDNLYSEIVLQFNKSSTTSQTYQILSCRVTSLLTQDYQADADMYYNESYAIPGTIAEAGASDYHISDIYVVRINVYDWMKYDSLTIWGSVGNASIDSARATIGTKGLPMTFSYCDPEASGQFTHYYTDIYESVPAESGDATSTAQWGKYLFCITIDLSQVDRTATSSPLYVYVTGSWNQYVGFDFTGQYVNGSITVPDTSDAGWWSRFTKFMTELMGGDTADADEYASEMQQQSQELQDAVDTLDSVTKPAVDQIDVSLDSYLTAANSGQFSTALANIFKSDVIVTMLVICLTCALVAYALYGKR